MPYSKLGGPAWLQIGLVGAVLAISGIGILVSSVASAAADRRLIDSARAGEAVVVAVRQSDGGRRIQLDVEVSKPEQVDGNRSPIAIPWYWVPFPRKGDRINVAILTHGPRKVIAAHELVELRAALESGSWIPWPAAAAGVVGLVLTTYSGNLLLRSSAARRRQSLQ